MAERGWLGRLSYYGSGRSMRAMLSVCSGFFQLPLLQVIEIALGNCQMFSLSWEGRASGKHVFEG